MFKGHSGVRGHTEDKCAKQWRVQHIYLLRDLCDKGCVIRATAVLGTKGIFGRGQWAEVTKGRAG